MKPFKTISLLLCTALIAFTILGCTATTNVTVPITIINASNDTYTLWVGHDETIRASNDLVGGGARPDSISLSATGPSQEKPQNIDDQLKVHVAKDGKRISSQKLAVNMPYTYDMALTVTWDGKSFTLK